MGTAFPATLILAAGLSTALLGRKCPSSFQGGNPMHKTPSCVETLHGLKEKYLKDAEYYIDTIKKENSRGWPETTTEMYWLRRDIADLLAHVERLREVQSTMGERTDG
jgi:hypothetical protein